ncbi:MAG: glycogen/starch synthase [Candidatus Marinimicrobia bacterium]|jgi:starch synthase|nr:glycogen/starch synthase [Candidatus Neomarinimicrobiota bacterium]MBT3502335.1 glycogen/starch synthase [Candidatus Neomarinimicrobiota bacterium]MBT3840383.1 glycogen/starch synthase [Candidatus Neomarinimicrobiota bacterium]MBT3999448.1 glycogen/starch synthase [Candidatus Neomarinimicrobiota bacterium]MBT4282041.1 glycogen/starch synthase [Candidatus Neomarinimicrobiota bacterium]
MSKKLYYLTTEITPFANVSGLGEFSAKVPLALQEKGHDIRTIIPKYGYVSERKYILREVIRLREIPFVYKGEEISASAKSAFIPKTRVQVYFLEDEYWFKPLSDLVYKSKNGRVLADNGERYGFFAKAVLSTLPHLFWAPDIFICNGWQSAMVPGMFKKHFDGINEFYKEIKTVMVIHDLDEYAEFSRTDLDNAEVPIHKSLKGKMLNIYEVGAFEADAIIIFDKPSSNISKELLLKPGIKANKKKVNVIKWSDDETPDYLAIADKMDKVLKKLSD